MEDRGTQPAAVNHQSAEERATRPAALNRRSVEDMATQPAVIHHLSAEDGATQPRVCLPRSAEEFLVPLQEITTGWQADYSRIIKTNYKEEHLNRIRVLPLIFPKVRPILIKSYNIL